MNPNDVVIVSACRTPVGTFGGSLTPLQAPDLGAVAIKEAVKRSGLDRLELIDDVRMGCCLERCDAMNTARVAMIRAGIPQEVPAVTINRVCNSGMEAIIGGMQKIQVDPYTDIIVAGGLESMSNQPFVSFDARWGARLQDKTLSDAVMTGLHAGFDMIMGLTAENLVEKHGLTREEQDEVALRSHNNVERATSDGSFKEEIVPTFVPQRRGDPKVVDKDEHFRPGLTLENLAKLPPVFKKDGTVTAGNASGINDGAAAVVIMSAKKAEELSIKPLARIVGSAVAGVDPYYMGEGPIPATKKLFERIRETGLTLDDMDLIECNEAFAAVYLTCEKKLGFSREITNVNGSGIGIGHPVGCTGTRMIVTLLHELRRRQKSHGLATLCGGGGLGMSTIIEVM